MEFYLNLRADRKNFLIVTPAGDGLAHIVADAMTDAEIDEIVAGCDYSDALQLSALAVGESCRLSGSDVVILRIS